MLRLVLLLFGLLLYMDMSGIESTWGEGVSDYILAAVIAFLTAPWVSEQIS